MVRQGKKKASVRGTAIHLKSTPKEKIQKAKKMECGPTSTKGGKGSHRIIERCSRNSAKNASQEKSKGSA